MRLWVTRAEPDASAQARRLAALGHDAVVEPLLQIAFDAAAALPLDGAQALIATSRNGLRALARRGALSSARGRPLFVVGPASAALGRELGFDVIHEGPGTADGLVQIIAAACAADAGPLLHLAGATAASDLKGALERRGFTLRQPVLYEAVAARALKPALRDAIRAGDLDGVILMSPRTAKIYLRLMSGSPLRDAVSKLRHFCLSDPVAARLAPLDDVAIRTAARPREEDLFALLSDDAMT